MATKFVEADVEDLSQCHVCLLQFSDERIPKFLNCSHTFCLPCLKSIGKDHVHLNCPECRATIDVPQGDPTKLPTNRAVLKMAKLPQITKCETCGRECINNKCFHCGKSICAECVKEHEKTVETEMNKLRNDLQGSLSHVRKFKSTVNVHLEALDKDTENNVQQVEKNYKLLEQALKDRKEQLIEQVKINSSAIHTRHDTVQGVVVKNITNIEALLTDIDGVSDSISSLTKQTIDSIMDNGEEAINQMNQISPNCDIRFTAVYCDSKVDGLLGAIENWGYVTPQEGVNVKLTGSPTELTDGKKQQSLPRPQTSGQLRKHNIQEHTKNTDQPEEYSLLPLFTTEKEKTDFEDQAKQEREAREAAEIGKAEAEKKAEKYRIEKEAAEKEKTNFEHQAKRERKARDVAEQQKAVAEKNAEKYCVEKETAEKEKADFEDQANQESEARDAAERQKAEAVEKAEKYRVEKETAEKEKADFEDQAKQESEARDAAERQKAEAEEKAEKYRVAKETAERGKTEAEEKAETYRRAKEAAEKEKADFEDQAKQEREAKDAAERRKSEAEEKAEKYRVAKEAAEKEKVDFEDQAKRESEARDAAERQKTEAEEKSEKYRVAKETAERGKTEAEEKAETYRRAKETAEKEKADFEDQAKQDREAREAAERGKTEAEEKAETYRRAKETAERQKAEAEKKAEKYRVAKETAERGKTEAGEKAETYRRAKEAAEKEKADFEDQAKQERAAKKTAERQKAEAEKKAEKCRVAKEAAEREKAEAEEKAEEAKYATDLLEPTLIVLGGVQYKQQGKKEQVTVADCSVLKDNTWQTVAQLPVAKWCNYTSCVVGGDIVVTGGMEWNDTTGTDGRVIAQCWRLQTSTMKWEQLPNLHHKRYAHGCMVSRTSLYVVGGWGGGKPVAPVECLVAGGQHWEARAAMPTPVREAGTTAYSSDIYSFGGKNSDNKATNITQIYSTRTDTWRTAAPLPKASMVVTAVRHNNTIYVFDYWSPSYRCYIYNPASDVFTTLVSSPTRHFYAPPVVWQGKVLLMSGSEDSRTVTVVEEYDPAKNSWTSSTVPLLRQMRLYSMHCMLN